MTFLEYIEQTIVDMLADIKGQQEAIAALEGAREFYRMYLEDCNEAKPTETRKEALPVPVAIEVPATPAKAAPEPIAVEETGRIIGNRRRKEFWTPERKAEASWLAKENHAKRRKRPPVKERPRADFKKAVIPVLKPVRQEPKAAWSDQARDKSDIVHVDDCPLSIAGAVLFDRGKYISHLDKEQKAVMERLILNFKEQTLRAQVKDFTRNLDRTISELCGVLALTETKIEATNGGWKLVAMKQETV